MCSPEVYLYFVERDFPYRQKYLNANADLENYKFPAFREFKNAEQLFSHNNERAQSTGTDIERRICEELRLTYPLPFILPEEMTWKYINQYLDE